MEYRNAMGDDSILALKHQLADAILELAGRMPITVAGRRLGIGPARMCDLRHGRVARFSIERLIRILGTIDRDVRLTVVPRSAEKINWFPKLRARRGLTPVEQRRIEGLERTRERREQAEEMLRGRRPGGPHAEL
jgi:hypothetical protein